MRSFFNKPPWASTAVDSTSSEFYRRSRQTCGDIVAANRQQGSVKSFHSKSHHVRDDEILKRRRLLPSRMEEGTDTTRLTSSGDLHHSVNEVTAQTDSTGIDRARSVSVEQNGRRNHSSRQIVIDTTQIVSPGGIADVECSPCEDSSIGSSSTIPTKNGSLGAEHTHMSEKMQVLVPNKARRTSRCNSGMANTQNNSESPYFEDGELKYDSPTDVTLAHEDEVVQILITSGISNTKPLVVQRRMSQRLRDVRLAWCKHQNFGEDVASSVFLTWRGNRLFDVTTCRSLGITALVNSTNNHWPSDIDPFNGINRIRIRMEAMTEEIMRNRKKSCVYGAVEYASDPDSDDKNNNEFFEIVLKGPGFSDLKMNVGAHTAISYVITIFRAKRHVRFEKEVLLLFDGEVLSPSSKVEDHDISDLDLVDVLVK